MANPFLEAGAVLGSAAVSAFGQERANRTNIRLAREQMQFQERMRSTQYQTAVEDLRAAGLNPILAAGASAGTPSGATAHVEDAIGKGVSSALAAKRIQREFAAMDTQIDLNKAQKRSIDLRNEIDKVKGYWEGESAQAQARMLQNQKQFNDKLLEANLTDAETARINAEIDRKMVYADAIGRRTGKFLGSAASAKRLFGGSTKYKNVPDRNVNHWHYKVEN